MLACLALPCRTLEEIKVFFESYALESRMSLEKLLSPQEGLERMRGFLRAVGDPQETYKTIHIAGTTGKGSTCLYLAAILQAHGFKTGLSVSPHIVDIRERFQINGELVSETRLVALLEMLLPVMCELDRGEAGAPSYMEFLRMLSYALFAQEQVDYAVVETGMGGRFDSSNTIRRADKICVITKLGLDHVKRLGETIEAIAYQKIGIVQPGNDVVIGWQEDISVERLQELARAEKASAIQVVTQEEIARWKLIQPSYLQENAALAEQACRQIAVRDEWVYNPFVSEQALQDCVLPLRFELIPWKGKTLIVDAAHNPQKMRGLGVALQERFPNEDCAVAFAFNNGTDVAQTFAPLLSVGSHFAYANVLGGEGQYRYRFLDPLTVVPILDGVSSPTDSIQVLPEWSDLLAWMEHAPEQVIVLTGSFHFAADVRRLLLS